MVYLAIVLTILTVIIAVISVLAKAMSSNTYEKFFGWPIYVFGIASIATWIVVFIS